MLAIERRNVILSKLVMDGKVLVSDLAKEFEVTEETIRRDLEKLDQDGLVHKTYGGAVKTDNINLDLPFHVRKKTNVEAKQKIASLIAREIDDGAYLMLDSSTTALCVIKQILTKKNITIITNSIEILLELCNKPEWNIISTGGTLKEGGLALVGYQAEKMLAGFHVDLAVCSCKGLDGEIGVTDSNERDAAIKNAMFHSAKRRILAVDSTKFDRASFVRVSDFSSVDTVVTDEKPNEAWLNRFAEANVEIIYE